VAGTSLLALIDDIASILDDVSAMTKVAAQKTAGVVGDDLAVNAEQVAGVVPDRELGVVWAVAKGSLINKVILVPVALVISWILPPLMTGLLMLGGAYLCFEGFEKVLHAFFHKKADKARALELSEAALDPEVDLVAVEKTKIRGAIRTDFILSAEIIVISLGTMTDQPLGYRVVALSVVAVAMTAFVYGLVAAIVKLDDGGLILLKSSWPPFRLLGQGMVRAAPFLMKGLGIAGTIAMFLVGGGILVHGLPFLAGPTHALEGLYGATLLANLLVGMLTGALVFGLVSAVGNLRAKGSRPS
jgi:uncharacterized protein